MHSCLALLLPLLLPRVLDSTHEAVLLHACYTHHMSTTTRPCGVAALVLALVHVASAHIIEAWSAPHMSRLCQCRGCCCGRSAVLIRHILVSCAPSLQVAWKMKRPSSSLGLEWSGSELPPPLDGRKGAAGLFLAVERD